MKSNRLKDMLADWVWANTPCCREMTHLISRGIDAPLPRSVRWRMALHLRFCVWCERYHRQLTLVQHLARRLVARESSDESIHLEPGSKERIRSALREGSTAP
jgi:hypothetical protein